MPPPPLPQNVLKTLSLVKLTSILIDNNWAIPLNQDKSSLIDAVIALQQSKEDKKPKKKQRILWSEYDKALFSTLLSKETNGSIKKRCSKILGAFNAKANHRRNVNKLVSKYHSMQRTEKQRNSQEDSHYSDDSSSISYESDSDYDFHSDEESDLEPDYNDFMNDKQTLITTKKSKKKKDTVLEYIKRIGYPQYVSVLRQPFRDNEICDILSLQCLDVDDLKDFGIKKLLHRKDIVSKIQKL